MNPNPTLMRAIEQLDYRATAGDVASQSGLALALTQRELLALAAETRGHLQVAESGEVIYLFPKDFRGILRNKFLRLRLQALWERVWRVLFYLIRVSFGIMLVLSIVLIYVTLFILVIAISTQRRGDGDRSERSGGFSFPMTYFWINPDWFSIFVPSSPRSRKINRGNAEHPSEKSPLNFLEAVFSFLFGDGNPNADLEDRRWQAIATTIRNQQGAIVAEHIAPYVDELGSKSDEELETYVLPTLIRFNGKPEVSPEGHLIYHFPDLQTTAERRSPQPVAPYLEEYPWKFSAAGTGQIIGAIALGAVNLVGALMLGSLLQDPSTQQILQEAGGLVPFVTSIYGFLLAYALGFLGIPLIRYLWLQWHNQKLTHRNQLRGDRTTWIDPTNPTLAQKLTYAHQFALETLIQPEDLAYTTEKDLLEQDIAHLNRLPSQSPDS